MSAKQLLGLLASLLPPALDPQSLTAYGKPEWWEQRPQMACAYALRKCPDLDWEKYLAQNPDLVEADVDPVWHFMKHGMFEGRKLCIREDSKPGQEEDAKPPFVTVIVYNHNKAPFLAKTINSIFGQTLAGLEIIVMDDGSKDESEAILQQLMASDSRLHVHYGRAHTGKHVARKHGVGQSRGKAIMFVNAGDYLLPDACEKAYAAVNEDFDIAAFNVNVVAGCSILPAELDSFVVAANRGQAGEWRKADLLKVIYRENEASCSFFNRIYGGDFCRKAFAEMPELQLAIGADEYEAMVLARKAATLAKLDDYLYVCRYENHASLNLHASLALDAATTTPILTLIKRFLEAEQCMSYYYDICEKLILIFLQSWYGAQTAAEATIWFNQLAYRLGIVEFICFMQRCVPRQWQKAAAQFCNYQTARSQRNIKTIGILYSVLYDGGAERVIRDLIPLLQARGYKVAIFLEEGCPNDAQLPLDTQIYYLGKRGGGGPQQIKHLLSLQAALQEMPVDVMLCHACYSGNLLWQVMLIKYLQIPVIMFVHSSFYMPLVFPGNEFRLQDIDALLRCGDKVIVLSKYDELYYHCRGIDAQYIPNPVRQPEVASIRNIPYARRCKNIIVFGRLGDEVKNISDTLRVFAEVKKYEKRAKITYIGSFFQGKGGNAFQALACRLGVEDDVTVTGWLNDPGIYIDEACVLLSTAYSESFSLSLVEAQTRGIPAVMYYLPIMPAEDNESVIRVPQGDYQAAAGEILELMNDEPRWRHLANIARQKSQQYSPESYIDKVEDMLCTFRQSAKVSFPIAEDYRVVIRALGFYGAHNPPWKSKNRVAASK